MQVRQYNILNKFLAFHFMRAFGLVFFCISGIIMLFSIINNMKTFVSKSVNFSVILEFSLLDVFNTLTTVLPLSVLLSGILAFWRLSRTSELTVIRSVGLSVWQFLAPVLFSCIVIGFFNMAVLSPIGSAIQRHTTKLSYKYGIGHNSALLFTQLGLWLKEKNDLTQSFINALYVKKEGKDLVGKDIVIFVTDLDNHFVKRIEAKDAILKNKNLELFNVFTINPLLYEERFDKYDFPTTLTVDRIEESSSVPQSFSFWELPGFISFFESAGFSARKYRAYFYQLLFMPLTLCTMLLIATIFSISPKRNQSNLVLKLSGGVLVGFGVFFMDQIIRAMGTSGRFPLFISTITMSVIVILVCVTVLLYKEDG